MCMTTTSNTLYACIIFSKSKGCVNIRELSIPQRLRGAMDPGCDSFLGVKLPVTLVSVCLLSKGRALGCGVTCFLPPPGTG